MIEELIIANADKGFAYAVAVFLLIKGYGQDKEYLLALRDLRNEISKLSEKIK